MLPGGQRQYAGGYSSHRGMSGYGGNTQIYIPMAVEGHTANWDVLWDANKQKHLQVVPVLQCPVLSGFPKTFVVHLGKFFL